MTRELKVDSTYPELTEFGRRAYPLIPDNERDELLTQSLAEYCNSFHDDELEVREVSEEFSGRCEGWIGDVRDALLTAMFSQYRRLGIQVLEDCVHDALLKMHEHMQEHASPDAFLPYVRQVARRECLTVLRNRTSESAVAYDELDSLQEPDCPEEFQERLWTRQAVNRALNTLPDDQRMIVDLIHYENMTYEDAANHLKLNVNTLKKKLQKARVKLARILRSELE